MTNMIEVKTADLSGLALNWAVGLCMGWEYRECRDLTCMGWYDGKQENFQCISWRPSTNWNQGGPLIATHRVSVIYSDETCDPCAWTDSTAPWHGDTPLIAACRAIVASKLGDTVQIPAELLP